MVSKGTVDSVTQRFLAFGLQNSAPSSTLLSIFIRAMDRHTEVTVFTFIGGANQGVEPMMEGTGSVDSTLIGINGNTFVWVC